MVRIRSMSRSFGGGARRSRLPSSQIPVSVLRRLLAPHRKRSPRRSGSGPPGCSANNASSHSTCQGHLSGSTSRVRLDLYLGRAYRLRVRADTRDIVRLVRGFLIVQSRRSKQPAAVRDLVVAWYRDRADIRFSDRLEACLARFSKADVFRPKAVIVRHMHQRWGSMSPSGRLILNTRLIEAPIDAIDYVITHELCRLAQPHHGAGFFKLLQQVMPDWERRKARLERILA